MKTAATWVCIESGRFRFSTVNLIMMSDRLSISHWLLNCTNSNTACTMKETMKPCVLIMAWMVPFWLPTKSLPMANLNLNASGPFHQRCLVDLTPISKMSSISQRFRIKVLLVNSNVNSSLFAIQNDGNGILYLTFKFANLRGLLQRWTLNLTSIQI